MSAVCVLAALAGKPAAAVDIPPIRYTGSMVTTARVTVPDQGEKSYQLGSSMNLGASTYLWQPWFATVDGAVDLSQVNTYAANDSSAVVTGGEARVNVFPSSRFPFTAFVNVSDSRSELESSFVEEREVRTTLYGVTQRYQPEAGNATYGVTLQHTAEDGVRDDLGQTRDEADLQMNYRMDKHNINANLGIRQTRQDGSARFPGARFSDVLSSVQHSYRPTDTLSFENYASYSDQSTDTGVRDTRFTSAQLSSFASWNPTGSPLSMTGNAQLNRSTSGSGRNDVTVDSGTASATAQYEITPELRASATLSASHIRAARSSTSTGQSATVSYSPQSIALGDYQYNYFASASASNRTGGSDGGNRTLGASAGHGLNRFLPLNEDGAFNLSVSANQAVSTRFETNGSSGMTLDHSASASIGYSGQQSNTRLRFDVQDNRDLGSNGVSVQSAGMQLTHDMRFGRHATLNASANMSMVRQSFGDGDERSFPSSGLSVSYRHSRAFGVPRLRFSSELSTSAQSLTFVTAGDDDVSEINFENKLEYSIGRVDARLDATVRENNGRIDSFVFFSLTRRIGGVL